jgi:uncharacterized protein
MRCCNWFWRRHDRRNCHRCIYLFVAQAELPALTSAGMLLRRAVQFHWFNPGLASFSDYLATLVQSKRKKVRAERRKVHEAGVTLERKVGREIGEADWDFFYRCYRQTYAEHMSTPYLTRSFFAKLAQTLPESVMLVLAYRAETSRVGAGAVR